MRLVYDIECNGLTPDTIWMIVAQNLDTNQIYKFSDHDNLHGTIADGAALLQNAELLVGHNIIGFDNMVMDKICGTTLNEKRVHDTWVMSQVLRYKRNHRHGLAGWGESLGNSKITYEDGWDAYSREMLRYCVQDVRVNVDVYNELLIEYKKVAEFNPKIKLGMQAEHETAKFNAFCKNKGWYFDMKEAKELLGTMQQRMAEISNTIEPQMGTKVVFIDKEPKTPKYKKNGTYTATTAKLLSEYFETKVSIEDTHLAGPSFKFQRTTKEQSKLGSQEAVKEWLTTIGWKPDEYNRKKIGREWVTTGPKLTTSSLSKLGEVGLMVDEYYVLRHKASLMEGWVERVEITDDKRLHGNMWTIGTPTFRVRHEVIANLPGIETPWGKEIRGMLKPDPGTVIVGADSAGNQLRGLCHYVGNDDFTNEVRYGDQHQRNADALGCSRGIAKGYLYAYLFGAGDAKLGQVLTGKSNSEVGRKSRINFSKGIKGLEELKKKLLGIWNKTSHNQGDGWFPALDGRPVFCGSGHQTLNYLLQAAEGVTCKAALMWAWDKIKEEKLRAEPRLFYHDEMAFQSHPDDAKRVGEILKESFTAGPELFGVTCMDGGDYVIGESYADVH
jgi:DNA polymerase-1|tara:strand:+ start:381 stop:2219 length:1839 start_codon:yes stop_codon:yes gene_type:complete